MYLYIGIWLGLIFAFFVLNSPIFRFSSEIMESILRDSILGEFFRLRLDTSDFKKPKDSKDIALMSLGFIILFLLLGLFAMFTFIITLVLWPLLLIWVIIFIILKIKYRKK